MLENQTNTRLENTKQKLSYVISFLFQILKIISKERSVTRDMIQSPQFYKVPKSLLQISKPYNLRRQTFIGMQNYIGIMISPPHETGFRTFIKSVKKVKMTRDRNK